VIYIRRYNVNIVGVFWREKIFLVTKYTRRALFCYFASLMNYCGRSLHI